MPGSVPGGAFTGGSAYAARWRLPPPVRAGVAAGDLVSAIRPATPAAAPVGGAPAAPKKDEEEMDDLELMAAILGKN